MLHERDVFKLLGRFIADEIGKQMQPVRDELAWLKQNVELNKASVINGGTEFSQRIERMEKILGDLPVPVNGRDGKDGAPGKDAVFPWDEMNEQLSAGIAMIREQSETMIAKKLAEIPAPKDGKDGRDGVDGTDGKDLSVDDVMPFISAAVDERISVLPAARGISSCLIDRSGGLVVTFSDGSMQNVGAVVGKDGAPGDAGKDGLTREEIRSMIETIIAQIPLPKDGKDGAGFDDVEMQYDGERSLSFVFFRDDPLKTKQFNFTLPIPLYREVWRAKAYDQFDIVQRDGSMWIAITDTATTPGTSADWKLCVKRGQNGKQGEPGPPGPRGGPVADAPSLPVQWPLKGA